MSSRDVLPPPAGAEAEEQGAGRWKARAARAREAGWKRAGWLAAELLVVFVGVYAAFLLEAVRERREEDRRERRIYETLHRELSTTAPQLRAFSRMADSSHRAFSAALEAGRMPEVAPIEVSALVDDGAWNAMLQGGGLEVLDVDFIQRMETMYVQGRYLSVAAARAGDLSARFVWPRLEEGNAVFYDPATRRLRPAYSWYPLLSGELARRAADLSRTADTLHAELAARVRRK